MATAIDPLMRDRPLRTEEQLKKLGFTDEDMREHRALQTEYIQLLADYELAEEEKRFEESYALEQRIAALATTVHFRGEDPSTIPLDILKYMMQSAPDRNDDAVTLQYRARNKSKAPAIRAKCVRCMGGQPALVRECSSLNCPLWPFRMGTNPLRGVVPPPKSLVDISDELAAQLATEIVEDESTERDDNANS